MATQVGCVKSAFHVSITRKTFHCESPLSPCRIRYTARVTHAPLVRKASSNAIRVRCCSNNGRESGVAVEKVEGIENSYSCVMKFGGSSVANAVRMREVANLILSFPEERPIIVLSAMGKTTNRLLLAGEKAVSCGVTNADSIDELSDIKDLHLRTVEELGVDRDVIAKHLEELEQLLKGIAMMKELTPRTQDYLVSFGECMSTRIFAAYLNKLGLKARQARKSCAVTTLGRGGSDLTATTIGKALGLPEIQVWKDVDGVLTCDPNLCPQAEPVPFLTFDEAAELAYFGAQKVANNVNGWLGTGEGLLSCPANSGTKKGSLHG